MEDGKQGSGGLQGTKISTWALSQGFQPLRGGWCKQEQDNSSAAAAHSFQELHQLNLWSIHNFFQPNVMYNLMSLDSSAMEHSSGSNSVIYSSGASGSGGSNGSF